MADQGVASAGTFVVTLVLARNLSATEFGVFAVLMGILIMALTINTSLIGIPLMVLSGRSAHRDQLPTVALGLAALSTAVFALALAVAVLVLGRPSLLPWAVLALFGTQVQETLRRSLMGRLQFRRAMGGDALSYLGQAAGVILLAATGRATVAAALGIMGVTSLAAAAVQVWQVRPSFGRHAFRRETVQPFWRLGGALVVVNGIGALNVQAYVWLLGAFHGVAAVGSLQALLTVVGPTNALMLAANSLVTTGAANIHESDPRARHHQELGVARRYGVMVGIPLLVYCGILVVAPGPALELFFGPSSAYAGLTADLRLFVLFSIAQYGYFVSAGILNARQETKSLLRVQLGSALVVLLSVPLIAADALRGSVIGLVASSFTRVGLAARATARGAETRAGSSSSETSPFPGL